MNDFSTFLKNITEKIDWKSMGELYGKNIHVGVEPYSEDNARKKFNDEYQDLQHRRIISHMSLEDIEKAEGAFLKGYKTGHSTHKTNRDRRELYGTSGSFGRTEPGQ